MSVIRLESLSPKHLFICFEGVVDFLKNKKFSKTYWLKSVPLSKLFKSSQDGEEHDEESVLQPVSDYMWKQPLSKFGISSRICFLPTKAPANLFYTVYHGSAGVEVPTVPARTLSMLKYSISIDNSIIKLHETRTGFMNSRLKHLKPISVEIGGLIYVLSQDCIYDHEEDDEERIVFQVYNPAEDLWTTLPSPPHLGISSHYLGTSRYVHMVIRNKLYISTLGGSSVFCTETKKWWDPRYLYNERILVRIAPAFPEFMFGSPFLVVFKDVLLVSRRAGLVDAFKVLECGQFVFMHELWEKELVQQELYYDSHLIDLGDGHICLVIMTWAPEEMHLAAAGSLPTLMKFILFKVSESPDGKTLNCSAPQDAHVSTVRLSTFHDVFSIFAC